VLIIRHAESQYNLAQKKAKNSEKEVHAEDEDLNVKFCYELIDCSITEFGIE
jgi:hypothetical protein